MVSTITVTNRYDVANIETINKINYKKFCKFFPKNMQTNELVSFLLDNNYFTAPGSKRNHGAWIGGLFDHSVQVTKNLLQYTEENNIHWQRPESPYIVGMFHDLCKIDIRTFDMSYDGRLIISTKPTADTRHSEKSLELIQKYLELTTEEKLCIYYHMGSWAESYDYDVLMKRMAESFPTITWTQRADTVAAYSGI